MKPLELFVAVWQISESLEEVTARLQITSEDATAKADWLRGQGVKLKDDFVDIDALNNIIAQVADGSLDEAFVLQQCKQISQQAPSRPMAAIQVAETIRAVILGNAMRGEPNPEHLSRCQITRIIQLTQSERPDESSDFTDEELVEFIAEYDKMKFAEALEDSVLVSHFTDNDEKEPALAVPVKNLLSSYGIKKMVEKLQTQENPEISIDEAELKSIIGQIRARKRLTPPRKPTSAGDIRKIISDLVDRKEQDSE